MMKSEESMLEGLLFIPLKGGHENHLFVTLFLNIEVKFKNPYAWY